MHECASRNSNTPNSMVFWLAYNSTHAKMSMMSSACDKRLVYESCGFLRRRVPAAFGGCVGFRTVLTGLTADVFDLVDSVHSVRYQHSQHCQHSQSRQSSQENHCRQAAWPFALSLHQTDLHFRSAGPACVAAIFFVR
jgi:hypothetical protein